MFHNVDTDQLSFLLMYIYLKTQFDKHGLSQQSGSDQGGKYDEALFDSVFVKLSIPMDLIKQMELLQISQHFKI